MKASRMPVVRFENLPDHDFEPHCVEIDGPLGKTVATNLQ